MSVGLVRVGGQQRHELMSFLQRRKSQFARPALILISRLAERLHFAGGRHSGNRVSPPFQPRGVNGLPPKGALVAAPMVSVRNGSLKTFGFGAVV